MDDGWDGEQQQHSSVGKGIQHQHQHRGTSRFNHRGQYRTQRLRQHHHHHQVEHEHDSGTDDNDGLPSDEFTSIQISDDCGSVDIGGHSAGSLHHRHHIPPSSGEDTTASSIPEQRSLSPPPPMVRHRNPDDDDYPLHHRAARAGSPPPPPPPPPGSDPPTPGPYSPAGRRPTREIPKFGSPYRRAGHHGGAAAGPAAPSGHAPYYHGITPSHRVGRRKWSVIKLIQCAGAACVLCYLAVVVRSMGLLDIWSRDRSGDAELGSELGNEGRGARPPGSARMESARQEEGGGIGYYGGFVGGFGANDPDSEAPVVVKSAAAERAREWLEKERTRARGAAQRRRDDRKRRTRPPPPRRPDEGDGVRKQHLARYDFSVLDEKWEGVPALPNQAAAGAASDAPPLEPPEDDAEKAQDSPLTPAAVEKLCGPEAKEASRLHPNSYLSRDALSSDSRVLITGILGPIGFHLALALKEKCGVKTIMGIDPMYPNSVLHRLELQERIATLTQSLPGLGQPIMLPYVGLDPRLSPKKLAEARKTGGGSLLLPGTGELDFMTFRPTHVVHLASASRDAYRDEEGRREGKWNDNSPYCSPPPELPEDDGGDGDAGDGGGGVYRRGARVPPLYEIRQSSAGMEHLLTSVGNVPTDAEYAAMKKAAVEAGAGERVPEEDKLLSRPHLTYASHSGVYSAIPRSFAKEGSADPAGTGGKDAAREENFHPATKLIDEVLARTYGALRNVRTVGLRLGDVYGPWGERGSRMRNATEEVVRNWGSGGGGAGENDGEGGGSAGGGSLSRRLRDRLDVSEGAGTEEADMLFVDDAVRAIIAAMQYSEPAKLSSPSSTSPATVFDATSGERASLFDVAGRMETLSPGKAGSVGAMEGGAPSVAADSSKPAKDMLGWSAQTDLNEGLARTVAWHLDRKLPYGPASKKPADKKKSGKEKSVETKDAEAGEETGDAFLLRQKLSPCPSDDPSCLRGKKVLPCASECNGLGDDGGPGDGCTPSPFDSVLSTSRDLTEGCDVVLYTSSLGYDVKDIKLQATYEDPVEGQMEVCNVAFVPRECSLVKKAVTKVPDASLKKLGVKEKDGKVDIEKRLEALNGRILHKGWVLVWLPDAIRPDLPPEVLFLPKLSPGKLFASSAERVMFVNETFTVVPNTEDVLFLASEMHRGALKERTFTQKDETGKKRKYRLAPEPERRAAILFNTMKQKKPDPAQQQQEGVIPKPKKVSVYEAVKHMVIETGGDPEKSDPKPLKRQREFYERVPTFANRDDLRSAYEPAHRYEMRHWVRSRWVLHDLTLEEGRLLRCEWYDEHVRWGNDLDQLSFAHVMARREVERKFARDEPDDHARKAMAELEEPVAEGMTDKEEWHQLLRVGEGESGEADSPDAPGAVEKVPEDAEKDKEGDDGEKKAEVDLFARIMSDKVMLMSRKIWAKK